MKARYEFSQDAIERMPVSIQLQATLAQWREVLLELRWAEKFSEDLGVGADPIRPLIHCISNTIEAIEAATSVAYETRGYTFKAERVPADRPSAAKGGEATRAPGSADAEWASEAQEDGAAPAKAAPNAERDQQP